MLFKHLFSLNILLILLVVFGIISLFIGVIRINLDDIFSLS
ncbi:ABC transporter permease, partial [Campylobacter coli]